MRVEVVIASYNDTLHWVELFKCVNERVGILEDCVFTPYRTGEPMAGAIMLDNKGREAGQWLSHIVMRYDSLADVTIFVQADLAWSTGQDWSKWPHDLNILRNIRLPTQRELGPMDDFSFYTWPNWDRIPCLASREPGMRKEQERGAGVTGGDPAPWKGLIEAIFGSVKEPIISPNIFKLRFAAAQHAVTRGFIRRMPLSHYEKCLQAARENPQIPYWLEFGGWPVFVYDIYRQGATS